LKGVSGEKRKEDTRLTSLLMVRKKERPGVQGGKGGEAEGRMGSSDLIHSHSMFTNW